MAGIKPQEKSNKKWSHKLAYAVGLLASDGCLSKDGRHIDLTSKDTEQLENFMNCLEISNKIGQKSAGHKKGLYGRVQFGDVAFYKFLLSVGLTPAKSKTLGALTIPKKYFFDFLRGSFDGDGSFYSYYDPRWRSSFMFYSVFVSASPAHILWIRAELEKRLGVIGHISEDGRRRTKQLRYAKEESWKILRNMYYSRDVICLSRKRQKIEKALSEIGRKLPLGKNAQVEKLVNSLP